MSPNFTEITLKGGSLNKTSLRTYGDGRKVVRKSVSRTADREYGFVRWHSQYKRQQRYNALFPGLFPALLQCGAEGDAAFIEMEYVEGSVDLKTYLQRDLAASDLETVNTRLWSALDQLHDAAELRTFPSSLSLYFEEEVVQRLEDAYASAEFRQFAESDDLVLNERKVTPLIKNLDWLQDRFARMQSSGECYTHGNVTLENVLYVPESGQIVFVDPYEENVVDCREAEYSQVLQCSNAMYGFVNDRDVTVTGNTARFDLPYPRSLLSFNQIFTRDLRRKLDDEQFLLVKLLEASQFVRMLPFKVAADQVVKAKYFYCVASELVSALQSGEN